MSIIRIIHSRADFEAALIVMSYILKYDDNAVDWTEDMMKHKVRDNPVKVWEHPDKRIIILTNDDSFTVKLAGKTDISKVLNVYQHNPFSMEILNGITRRINSFIQKSENKTYG